MKINMGINAHPHQGPLSMVTESQITNYRQAVDYLLSLVDHERQTPALPRQKRIYDLRRVTALLARLGDPHLSARTVHIAGTKGKGSTAAMVDSILGVAGYRTGFYSSPHLHTFRERIRLGGEPVSEDVFAGLVEKLAPVAAELERDTELGPVTLFEFMTAMAFQCFAEEEVDFQTIEVGLGGRLDATNVVEPKVCAITSVSLDHMAILGDTVEEIAADKAGIIKPRSPSCGGPAGFRRAGSHTGSRQGEKCSCYAGRSGRYLEIRRPYTGRPRGGTDRRKWQSDRQPATAGPAPT